MLKQLCRVASVCSQPLVQQETRNFHIGSALAAWGGKMKHCDNWLSYNDKMYPPQLAEEPRRPAFVCHVKENIKYSYKRMWYVACLIRGMSVDEALKQLDFVNRKGAVAAKETLLEAQELAVKEHNVEFKTNLWVAESFVGKGTYIKGIRRHAKGRMGEIRYGYIHYFVRLEEGAPPADYYPHKRRKTSEEMLNEWLETMRRRRISSSL